MSTTSNLNLIPNRVSISGMYDCHAFRNFEGNTVGEIIYAWLEHTKANMDTKFGPTSLCPAVVFSGNKEVRRVGEMVHPPRSSSEPFDLEPLKRYQTALELDPDISMLLRGGRDKGLITLKDRDGVILLQVPIDVHFEERPGGAIEISPADITIPIGFEATIHEAVLRFLSYDIKLHHLSDMQVRPGDAIYVRHNLDGQFVPPPPA